MVFSILRSRTDKKETGRGQKKERRKKKTKNERTVVRGEEGREGKKSEKVGRKKERRGGGYWLNGWTDGGSELIFFINS